jgi:hypothetical protein
MRKLEEIAHAKDAKDGKVYRGFIFFWGRDCSRKGRKGREGRKGLFEIRNAKCGNWPSVAPNLADSGGAMEGLRWKGGLTMKG